ncbi:putative secreted protein [Candidatus Rhodobacter oscarellae]|uniref:Putative secreted protein n=1 Tax=Candidatus Rhodobacter oscarellae TaxID=1675527 RepID=A0A0J9E9J1_9RHOB|nr:hypothetical protein [Candidatus Rhodobacter lobularis]KMW59296.1 putative secreted protein [Candidatus Rhodobacter lobularis]
MLRLALGLICGAAAQAQAQGVRNIETEGNLVALAPLACVAVEAVGAEATPADISFGMRDCLRQENGATAFDLFILLITRGSFDAKRVADRSAGQAINMLLQQVGSEAGEAMLLMGPHQQAYLADGSPERAALCALQRQSGPPAYHPRYMIQHGIKAVTGLDGDGLIDDFQAEREWETTLLQVAKCDRP